MSVKSRRLGGRPAALPYRSAVLPLAAGAGITLLGALGWWRTRPAQERYNLPARYSLIVSIRTPETDVDLYTPIADMIAAPVNTSIVIET